MTHSTRAFWKIMLAPVLYIGFRVLNGALAITLMIGGMIIGADIPIWLWGKEATGRDMTGLFPFAGLGIGTLLAIGICGFLLWGYAIPFAIDYILGTAEDLAQTPPYKKVWKRGERYMDAAEKYFDER